MFNRLSPEDRLLLRWVFAYASLRIFGRMVRRAVCQARAVMAKDRQEITSPGRRENDGA